MKETFNFIDNILYKTTPHDLTNWCSRLLRYTRETDTDPEKFVLEIVHCEGVSLFGDKLTTEIEKNRLNSIVSNYLKKDWGYSGVEKSLGFYVPVAKFGGFKKSYMLSKITSNEWTNNIIKGIHIYGT